MHHIIYLSQTTRELSAADLVPLLQQARCRNEQLGVTGALVYSNRRFMQVIEGEEAVLTALYDRIAHDPRHQDVFRLADKAIPARRFKNWSMAFRELTPGEFDDLMGYASPAHWEQFDFSITAVDTLFLDRMQNLILSHPIA